MTTRKITTFLMCPAANGDALGGTPAASAASGGHIKKSAGWQHVYDLVLPALAEFGISEQFARTKNRDQQSSDEDVHVGDQLAAEQRVDVEEAGVAHDEAAEEEDEVGGAHGSGRLEFRPDGAEAIRKEVLPTNRTLGVLLDQNGQLSRRSARPVGAIPQVPDRRFALCGEVIPGLVGLEGGEVGFEVHG